MTIPYPSRLQWVVIWCTVVVSGHLWLGLRLADWLPGVREAVPGRLAEPARTVQISEDWDEPVENQRPVGAVAAPAQVVGRFKFENQRPMGKVAAPPNSGFWLEQRQPAPCPAAAEEPPGTRRCITIPARPAVPAIERKVLWRESAWGLPGYLQPAIHFHRERLAVAVIVVGLLLVWQASRMASRRAGA